MSRVPIEEELDRTNVLIKELREELDRTNKGVMALTVELQKANDDLKSEIAEHKKDEQSLKASLEKYRMLVENLPVGVAIVTRNDGSIIERNKTIMEMLGYRSKEDALADSLKATFYDSKDMDAFMAFSRANRSVKGFEVQSKRKDGSVFLASLTAVPDPGDPENRLIIVTQDITERKTAEEKLAHIASIPQLNPNPVVEINRNGEINYANVTVEKLFPDFMQVKTNHPFLSGWGKFIEELGSDENKTFVREINVNGRYYIQYIRYSPTIKGLLFYGADITDRKEAEIALARQTETVSHQALELELANTGLSAVNKELESFSYSVSHDLRAPLRSIDGFSQILLEEYGEKFGGESKDYLNRVRQASQRMGRLIDDLLGLSRVTRNEMHVQDVDLSALVDLIVSELRNAQPARRVEVVIQPGLTVRGDAGLLRIMLTNLLGNAWKFTGKHERAKIEFGKTTHDGKEVLFIRDDGAGFDMAYAGKLFQPFQRLHGMTEFEGTGIGLATVQRVINRHGGRIWAQGAVEKGATFYFII
jgi:PAS domain S-box-containing protein